MRKLLPIALAGALLTTPAPTQAGPLTRASLIDVHTYAPDISLDLRYATRDNFTRAVLPGYCKPIAVLRKPAAQALGRVQRRLRKQGLGLLVYDAYRPARATRAMVRWAQRSGNEWVLTQGYVARRSNHNQGAAVDGTAQRSGGVVHGTIIGGHLVLPSSMDRRRLVADVRRPNSGARPGTTDERALFVGSALGRTGQGSRGRGRITDPSATSRCRTNDWTTGASNGAGAQPLIEPVRTPLVK